MSASQTEVCVCVSVCQEVGDCRTTTSVQAQEVMEHCIQVRDEKGGKALACTGLQIHNLSSERQCGILIEGVCHSVVLS